MLSLDHFCEMNVQVWDVCQDLLTEWCVCSSQSGHNVQPPSNALPRTLNLPFACCLLVIILFYFSVSSVCVWPVTRCTMGKWAQILSCFVKKPSVTHLKAQTEFWLNNSLSDFLWKPLRFVWTEVQQRWAKFGLLLLNTFIHILKCKNGNLFVVTLMCKIN